MQHPNLYVWLIFFSTLDIVMTWIILHLGGSEVNRVAELVIVQHDLPGTIAYKFSLVLFFVVICEIVTRRRPTLGLSLAQFGVIISTVPVVVAFRLLLA